MCGVAGDLAARAAPVGHQDDLDPDAELRVIVRAERTLQGLDLGGR